MHFGKRPTLRLAGLVTSLILVALSSNAQSSNKVKSISEMDDSPVEIYYEDGRIAQIYRKERLEEFKVPVTLVENSCRPIKPLTCHFILPYARQYFAAKWRSHPTRKDQWLEYSSDPKNVPSAQAFVTRSQNDLFERILKRLPSISGQSENVKATLDDKNMGRFECSQEVATSLPTVSEILFWDENFESGNIELAMVKGYGARVNQNWRRVQGLEIEPRGNTVKFRRFKKDYGTFTDYFPLGLSYQLQLSFKAPNILEPDDELCMLKFDVNFTAYFTQILNVLSFTFPGPVRSEEFELFRTPGENPNPFARRVFEKESWDGEGIR